MGRLASPRVILDGAARQSGLSREPDRFRDMIRRVTEAVLQIRRDRHVDRRCCAPATPSAPASSCRAAAASTPRSPRATRSATVVRAPGRRATLVAAPPTQHRGADRRRRAGRRRRAPRRSAGLPAPAPSPTSRRVPLAALELADLAVEIPMIGTGLSLNVAVAAGRPKAGERTLSPGGLLRTPGRGARRRGAAAAPCRLAVAPRRWQRGTRSAAGGTTGSAGLPARPP